MIHIRTRILSSLAFAIYCSSSGFLAAQQIQPPENPQPNTLIRIQLPVGVDERHYLIIPSIPDTQYYLDRSASILLLVVPKATKLTIVASTSEELLYLELDIGSSTPNPPPVDPIPSPVTQIATTTKSLTKAALNSTGTVVTAKQLSQLYITAADKLSTSTNPSDVQTALPALKVALDAVLTIRPDSANWKNWRDALDAELIQLLVQGRLTTKEQIVATLKEIGQAIQATIPPAATSTKTSKSKQNTRNRLVRR